MLRQRVSCKRSPSSQPSAKRLRDRMPPPVNEAYTNYLTELQGNKGHAAVAEEVERHQSLKKAMQRDQEAMKAWNGLQMQYINNLLNQLMLSGLNKGGKTTVLLFLIFIHATGLYPDWYKGRRFTSPPNVGICGVKAEPVRDNLTDRLFGPAHDRGSGMIPADCIENSMIHHKHGGCYGQIDFAKVRWHNPDGTWSGHYSTLWPWAYTQSWETVQSYDMDFVGIDEECPNKFYTEMIGRISGREGQIRLTLTPLKGKTPLWRQFNTDTSGERGMIVYGVDDCDHWDDGRKDRQRARFQGAMDESARLRGLPVEGTGLVYQRYMECVGMVPEVIPRSHPQLIGLDFAHISGTSACLRAVFDPVFDKIYILNEFKGENITPEDFRSRIRGMGGHSIPCAWPHDGGRGTKKGDNSTIVKDLEGSGINVLPEAAYMIEMDGSKTNSKNAVIFRVSELMSSGKLVISSQCVELIEELSDYRHEDGVVLEHQHDHLIDALHNLIRMERFASSGEIRSNEVAVEQGEDFWNFNAYGD